jgi:deoxyribonuclease V
MPPRFLADGHIAALDVQYDDPRARVACVVFRHWTDVAPSRSLTTTVDNVAPYEPGSFFKRELPCLLAALDLVTEPLSAIVIDGYVVLSDDGRPGLGAHLFDALDRSIPIVGVAKTAFVGSSFAQPVLRGESTHPLFVTAAGISHEGAAQSIASMHGPYRMPTLLKLVDSLARGRLGEGRGLHQP